MKDDYLWDGSGEPDPDVEELERLLGSYRYRAQAPAARLEQQLAARRSFFWVRTAAAAAALVVMAAVGAWLLVPGELPAGELQAIAQMPELVPAPAEDLVDQFQPKGLPETTGDLAPRADRPGADPVRPKRRAPPPGRDDTRHGPVSAPAQMASEMAAAPPIINPFVDPETARHIERAQLLLRSFRNAGSDDGFDLDYERQSSRRLLAKNILLRRDAEARGKLPIEDLLGSLEPILIDIANLPDAPTRDDVSAIKARMEKKEIITALQVYSAPTLSRAF